MLIYILCIYNVKEQNKWEEQIRNKQNELPLINNYININSLLQKFLDMIQQILIEQMILVLNRSKLLYTNLLIKKWIKNIKIEPIKFQIDDFKNKKYNTPKNFDSKGEFKVVKFRPGNQVDCYVIDHLNKSSIMQIHKQIEKNQHKLDKNSRIQKVTHVEKDLNSIDYIRFPRYPQTLGQNCNKQELDKVKSMYLARDCVRGLEDLQKMGFVSHSDIKCDNISHYSDQGKFQLTDYDACIKMDQNKQKYDIRIFNRMCYQKESCYGRTKQQLEQREIKAVKKLIEFISSDKEAANQIIYILEKNKNRSYSNVTKELERYIIDKSIKQNLQNLKLKEDGIITAVTVLINIAKQAKEKGLTKQGAQACFKQLCKGAVSFGGLLYQKYLMKTQLAVNTQEKILQSYHNFDNINQKQQFLINSSVQFAKGAINCISNLASGKQANVIRQMKTCTLNSLQAGVNKLTIKGMAKVFKEQIKTSVNYASNTFVGNGSQQIIKGVANTTKAINVFKSSLKSSAIVGAATFAVSTAFDWYKGKSLEQSIIQNGKSAIGSTIGSAIGATLGSLVPVIGTKIGGAVGGMLGSLIASWF